MDASINHRENFLLQEILINISTAVVREGIQNALDERNRGDQTETVKVRIFLSGDKYALHPQNYLPLIESLQPHLKAKSFGIAISPGILLNQ
jgi:hypothetical protein